MSSAAKELWAAALDKIRARVTEQQFETWFRSLTCGERAGESRFVIKAPNSFSSSWLKNHYLSTIEQCLREAAGHNLTVAIVAEDLVSPGPGAAPDGLPAPAAAGPEQHGVPLNRLFVFDNFVVGPCNALAHAAATAVSEAPGKAYNPLFIHSSTGMGKTHLLQAACHNIRANHPDMNILYLSCENFVNEFIGAVERGELETFRYNYRHVDVLVIDDILETGATAHAVFEKVRKYSPESIDFCVMIKRKRDDMLHPEIIPQFVGHETDNPGFLIGAGFDYQGKFRDLPYIATLDIAKILS